MLDSVRKRDGIHLRSPATTPSTVVGADPAADEAEAAEEPEDERRQATAA